MSLRSFPSGGLAVVIGATGGIGNAVADALATTGAFDDVLRWSRSGAPPVDILREESIAAAAASLAKDDRPLRLVFDATGFLHAPDAMPEKSWRELDAEALARNFAVNTIGPALLMKHLLPLLPRDGKSVFATVSARVGSIGDNGLGGWYGYRAAKSALNQLVRTASIELSRRRAEAICVALHPGTVATDLSAPFSKSGLDVRPPAEAAQDLIAVIETLQATDTGGFFDHKGKPIPW